MSICDFCKKRKINIIPYKCKCGQEKLCSKCRYPETHECIVCLYKTDYTVSERDCTYDFKTEGKILIEKNNPRIIANKI